MQSITQPPADAIVGEQVSNGDVLLLPLTDTERIDYQKAAERCGLSLTAWMRSRLHEAAKREAKEA